MALIHCKECGKKVSDTASSCPNCGASIGTTEKNKTVAALLALFLGGIGIHKFYLGQTGKGVAYLLLFWTFVPAILALIDAIRFFTWDNKKFEKYVIEKQSK